MERSNWAKVAVAAMALLIMLAAGQDVLAHTSPCRNEGQSQEGFVLPPDLPVGTDMGQLAPDFTLGTLFVDDVVTLSKLRGCVVLLEFWASWCTPCRSSSPYVEELAARYRDQGLVAIGVSLDRNAESAAAFLQGLGLDDILALWGSFDQVLQVARLYNITAIPHVFLIDRQGIVRFSGHPGYLTADLIEPWL